MAQFKISGQTYAVSRELYEATIPRMSEHKLEESLIDLAVLEQAYDAGRLTCSPQDWNEVVELAKKLRFELDWRSFSGALGIHLEVR